jgi:hypothetical protein
LTSTIPGATITGTQDDWIVHAPTGLSFGEFVDSIYAVLTEPANPDLFNFVSKVFDPATGSFDLRWQSDQALPLVHLEGIFDPQSSAVIEISRNPDAPIEVTLVDQGGDRG